MKVKRLPVTVVGIQSSYTRECSPVLYWGMYAGTLGVALAVLFCGDLLKATEPAIVFDPRPESGIPPEAREQEMVRVEKGITLATLLNNAVAKVQVRYVDPQVWPTSSQQQVKAYLATLMASQHSECYSFQIWSQMVGYPEVDCLIEFSPEYQKRLALDKKPYRTGRLLIWKTEACLRDGSGRWWFVNNFHTFHQMHPQGDRSQVKRR